MELRDGPDINATLIGKYCGVDAPKDVIKSSGNTMFVRFAADRSMSGTGFQAVYSRTLGMS